MYISATVELYFKMFSFLNDLSYLVLLDTIGVDLQQTIT